MHAYGGAAAHGHSAQRDPSKIALQVVTVSFINAIFIFELLVFNFVYLLQILPEQGKEWYIFVCGPIVNILWVLAFWSYWMAHCCSPGEVTQQFADFVHRFGVRTVPTQPVWQPASVTYNDKWGELRPERAHHCSMTGKCVIRMDHYCPWVANCIGFLNHKYFLLLAIYGCISCFLGFFLSLPELIYCLFGWSFLTDTSAGLDWPYRIGNSVESWLFLLSNLVAVVITCLLGSMLTRHLPNLLKNLTTVEETYTGYNPYEFPASSRNAAEVLGFFGLDWFLPIPCLHPRGDGMSYARPAESLPFGLRPEWMDFSNYQMVEQLWHWRYFGQHQILQHQHTQLSSEGELRPLLTARQSRSSSLSDAGSAGALLGGVQPPRAEDQDHSSCAIS